MSAHDHHTHAPVSAGRTLAAALAVTLVFAAVEAGAGWWAGSLALLGDAGHMVSDAAALGLAALAAWVARQPATRRHSYGLVRAEVVAALINGLFMLLVVAGIVVEAIDRLQAPENVRGVAVMTVGGVGLGVNILVAILLSRGEKTLNTRAALLHVMGDLLGSVAAVLSGAVITFTGWTPIDPILSLFICSLILVSSLRLVREALHVIMEGVPVHLDLEEVGQAMAGGDKRILSVHDLHIWSLSSGMTALSAHVVIEDMGAWDDILNRIRHLLHDRFDIEHVTLQPETGVHVLQPMAWES
jgi:cobalt-zinc-cadmium efflux system protein